jgi:hypothetical protein
MDRIFFAIVAVLLAIVSCNESSTNPSATDKLRAYATAVDGCQRALRKGAWYDSLQSYAFDGDSLRVNVLVHANCCPETNRFITSLSLKGDSVHLRVQDTARALCFCTCPYEIKTVVTGDGIDSVYFTCEYQNSIIVSKLCTRD